MWRSLRFHRGKSFLHRLLETTDAAFMRSVKSPSRVQKLAGQQLASRRAVHRDEFRFRRPLKACQACATNSLPVPPPWISTDARVGATAVVRFLHQRRFSDQPFEADSFDLFFSSTTSFSVARLQRARAMRTSSRRCSAVVTKSCAPRFIASTAASTEP